MENEENVIFHKAISDFTEYLCNLRGYCVKYTLKNVNLKQ